MKKSRGSIVLILTAVLLGLLAFTCIFGFGKSKTGATQNIKTGLDLSGGVSITYQAKDKNPSASDMADTIYKLQKRVQQYSEEAQVYQEGTDRINIEIPGVSDANTILAELGKPGSLYFIAQTDAEGNNNYQSASGLEADYQLLYSIEELQSKGSIVLTGVDVASAKAVQIENDLKNKESAVSLSLTKEGTKKFAEATEKAYAAGQSIGIYYDGAFVSVPRVNAAITDGNAQITGMKDFAEAENLASTIRIGGLKVELEELRSNVVGAQLGEEAIRTSLIAGAIGLAIVIILMIFWYLLPGVVAGLALLIYVGLELVMLNAFDLTLTLPGIAGIVLSIGMAVDANVIIYARIKEEINSGKSTKLAIESGFHKALSAILDGNITTLIAAAVLGWLGSGSVRGFAMTLALGIVLSMFTALFVSRKIIEALYAVGIRKESLYAKKMKTKTYNFLKNRKIFFVISLVFILVGPIAMGVFHNTTGNALNYSLEFKGGTSTTAEFKEDLTIAEIDKEVKPLVQEVTKDANIQTQKVVGSKDIIIKTRELSLAERESLNQKLVEKFGVDESKITAESISSTISSEMRSDAILAITVATICMLLYIWFRFKDIRFASSAVLALVHDVLVVLAFYAVARISVGNTFIACMLTIVGYSINATIVIFDRIRENMAGIKKNADIEGIINDSVSQTLTRSIYTSLTTFVMIVVLYILGVASIREFALPIMAGIICGAYSSVCITGALWYVMKMKFKKKNA
ncbi:MAG TPA: protein translocase subunit SecD [Lachnospiraceae bacterium]